MPLAHDIAHLGHVELATPVLEDSVAFFVDYLGLRVLAKSPDRVDLRTWDDYERTSIVLVQSDQPGIRRTYLRAANAEALARRVDLIESAGLGEGWSDGDAGNGRTYHFHDPDGHAFGLYWDTEWYQPPAETVPSLKNQAEAYPSVGVGVRRLDHVNFLAADVEANASFMREILGSLITEEIVLDDGAVSASWGTTNNKGYDLVYTVDWTGSSGRLHHLAFATDTRADILRAADLALEHEVFIETGPHKHSIQQTFFLYVYEPGGNRVELCNAASRLVLAPDWQTISWTQAERAKGQAWGLKTIESFHTHGTPQAT